MNAAALLDLGWNCMNIGNYASAQTFFFLATVTEPGLARAHMSLAESLLATGRFQRGWYEYTWRSYLNGPSNAIRMMTGPPWSGEPIPNGRLLIVCDEGYGDMIQFARFIPKAAGLCREVILGWDAVLPPLFSGMPSVASAHAEHGTLPPYDAWVLLCDLPGVFGIDLGNIPADVPYLPVDAAAAAKWGAALNAAIPARTPRIGLFWSGRASHLQNRRRSLRLSQLAPILDVTDVHFVTVQLPIPDEDRDELAARPNVLDISAGLTSFAQTAAVIHHLDLIIGVDSAVAHLSGALAKPIWTLIYKPADWRWLIDRPDTPWYPTMRLFHQQVAGDWEPVIRQVAAELEKVRPTLRPST